jgi:Ca-activated chloride channel family protein
MFRFGDAAWLWALLLVPVLTALYWLSALRRRRALELFGDLELVRKLSDSVSLPGRRAKAVLQISAVALVLFALARPQFGTRVETVRSVGQDIVVAVDLSRSMLAEDISPNRLERARLAIFRLMEQLDGDRIGIVAFAADAFVQSPLTTDYGAAAMFLDALHPDMMPVQGTDLGEAMRVSLDALEQGANESRVLVLVTDGEDHEGNVEEQLRRVREGGVQLHVVGVGSTEGVPIPEYDETGNRQGFLRDEDGSVVTTRLDEATLQRLVLPSGGSVVRAGTGGTAFEDLIDRIARGDGAELEERQITQFEEQYQLFVGLALFLLVCEWLISERRRVSTIWMGRFE